MRTRARVWQNPVLWLASLLLALLAMLAACGGPTGAATNLASLTTATALTTDMPTAAPPTATNTPRPKPTATPRPRPTATPRPRPTATATPRPTPTATTPPPTPDPKTVVIQISGFAFLPSSVTIRVGDTVEWENMDGVDHTTTSDSGDPESWDSGSLATSATFSFTFTKPGTYTYHCAIHPSMTGTITVTS